MLHIVQVVKWGVAETPQIFTVETKAQAAYVESADKQWDQRYQAYCEHHGLKKEAFTAARAFVKSIDVSEKSTVNFWSLPFQELGQDDAQRSARAEEESRRLAVEIVAIKEGLTQLLQDVSKLADGYARHDSAPMDAQGSEQPAASTSPPPPAAQQKQESDPDKYTTKEWSVFVADIRRLCSGSKNECSLLPRGAWRNDVYSNATSLEYWDWVADRMEYYKERAKAAGYSVNTEFDSPDYLKFANKEGDASEESYPSEWEAWCAAGLYLEGQHS
ncbi:hypothetical protein [Geomonas sp.]|uniref:hypothetical protein n=1 Tax=Geomonas sp. TaxID=2651584 RepID=UPI002B4A1B25|nr:hypothetical protein [Geomonas sp.]HJV34030.1 hypothetical protein [Geomonas sp.]